MAKLINLLSSALRRRLLVWLENSGRIEGDGTWRTARKRCVVKTIMTPLGSSSCTYNQEEERLWKDSLVMVGMADDVE